MGWFAMVSNEREICSLMESIFEDLSVLDDDNVLHDGGSRLALVISA
jgi:hypothetical protein